MNINTFVHVQGSEIIQIACFTRPCGKRFIYKVNFYSLKDVLCFLKYRHHRRSCFNIYHEKT